MKKILVLAALAVVPAIAPAAHADTVTLPPYAGQAVQQLQDWGYNVRLQGDPNPDPRYMTQGEKSDCVIRAVDPTVTGPSDGSFSTVYVTMRCPSTGGSGTDSGSSSGS